jgi:hypothetical protein
LSTFEPDMVWVRDMEHLRALPQRYSRAIDARDIDAVAELFDPEGTVDGARGSLGVPAYLDNLRNAERVFERSMHILGDPLIEHQLNSDTAHLDTYAVVYQLRPADSSEADLTLGMRYLDDVVRKDEKWVITHRKATTLWTR